MDTPKATPLADLGSFVDALRVPGALQALEILRFPGSLDVSETRIRKQCMLPLLADVLASGAAPGLRILAFDDEVGDEVYFHSDNVREDVREALVTMLETRAHLPACRGLEK